MNIDILKKIIDLAIKAPSGDNSQPWKFVITKDNNIKLFNIPDRDNPILNIHQAGSYLSHGAVILNIKIAADNFGYKANVIYFPSDIENLVAEINFSQKERDLYDESLYSSIDKRITNRKHYKKNIDDTIVSSIFKDENNEYCYINFFKDQQKKDLISNIINLSEEVILDTKELHHLLFKDVMWTKKQELREKHGLYVKTLEFNPIQSFIFWLCRKWNTIKFLNKILSFNKFVSKQNSSIYKSSGILGFIVIKNINKINYVKAGELMQLIWLKSTCHNLGFQIISGLFFLNERIVSLGDAPLSEFNSKKIRDGYEKIKNIIEIKDNNDIIVTSFRLGEVKRTKAFSSRMNPDIVFEK